MHHAARRVVAVRASSARRPDALVAGYHVGDGTVVFPAMALPWACDPGVRFEVGADTGPWHPATCRIVPMPSFSPPLGSSSDELAKQWGLEEPPSSKNNTSCVIVLTFMATPLLCTLPTASVPPGASVVVVASPGLAESWLLHQSCHHAVVSTSNRSGLLLLSTGPAIATPHDNVGGAVFSPDGNAVVGIVWGPSPLLDGMVSVVPMNAVMAAVGLVAEKIIPLPLPVIEHPHVARVTSGARQGDGVRVSPRICLTASHVVRDHTTRTVFVDGVEAVVAYRGALLDVAVLVVGGEGFLSFPSWSRLSHATLDALDAVTAVTSRGTSYGHVVNTLRSKERSVPLAYVVSVSCQPGDSGAPVLGPDGLVAGLVVGHRRSVSARRFTFVVPSALFAPAVEEGGGDAVDGRSVFSALQALETSEEMALVWGHQGKRREGVVEDSPAAHRLRWEVSKL